MAITIHHLRRSQSERIVWLCEEIKQVRPDFEYELVVHQRDPMTAKAPTALKTIHAAGTAPILVDGTFQPPVVLAESQAIVEYLMQIHGGHHLSRTAENANYVQYLNWYSFANGSLQATMHRLGMMDMTVKLWKRMVVQAGSANGIHAATSVPGFATTTLEAIVGQFKGRLEQYVDMIDKRLAEAQYLAGDGLTASDIMTVFSLTTMRGFYEFSFRKHKNILRYLQDISRLPGYRAAMAKAEPGLEPMIAEETTLFQWGLLK